MERVAFILEQTNERIGCMLNPESFQVHRAAGVRSAQTLGTALGTSAQEDDPLIWTGGGRTEISLDLLFDLSLLADNQTQDVRELTQPLHELSENRTEGKKAPIVRFIWGKAWNVRCMVTSIAERYEQFTASGYPQRSWMSMRLTRISQSDARTSGTPPPELPIQLRQTSESRSDTLPVHEVSGSGAGSTGGRLDVIAQERYGNAGYWRLIATFNDLDDPMRIPAGSLLKLPPRAQLEARP